MTIYAWKHTLDGEIVTIVPAADSTAELDQWWNENFEEGGAGKHYTNTHLTEPLEHLFDDDLKAFKLPLMIFTHENENSRDEFIKENGFEEVQYYPAVDSQKTMIWVEEEKERKAQDEKDAAEGVRRTIGEVTGTAENDPWDTVPEETAVMSAPKGITGHGSGAHGGEGKLKKADDKSSTKEDETEESRIHVRKTEVDADGNVDMEIQVLDDREMEMVRQMKEEARQEKIKKEQEIREKAAAVGIDADKADTYTAIESGDTVVQQDNRLEIIETVFSNGKRAYRDVRTGTGIPEDQIERLRKKREAEAQIKDIEAEEEREKKEAEEAAKRAEEEKSDLQKKLDAIRGATTEAPVVKEKDPAARGEELMAQINEEIENGFSSRRVDEIVKEMVASETIGQDFADAIAADIISGLDDDGSDPDPIVERKIRRNLAEANDIFKKLAGNDTNNPNINRQNTPKKEGRKGDEFYFAVIPPGGYNTDEVTATIGQEAFIVVIPKEDYDKNGKIPGTDGGWFTDEELEDWEKATQISVEEIAPSVYKMGCNIGDAARHFRTIGSAENGLLLTHLGIDFSSIPFDWPYHYKKNGQRVTDNDFRMKAARILQIARDQGIVLEDEDGTVEENAMGIDLAAIAKTEQDITGEMKKLLGASGSTEDDVMAILLEAVGKAKARVLEAGLKVEDLQNLSPEIKDLLETL